MCTPHFTEKDMADLTGYVAIVTGGNSGIGLETTKQLALRNARVYIASRSQQRVDEAIKQLNSLAEKPLDLHFLQMDLADLRSVKAAAEAFKQRESRLDILINNAGIMAVPFKLTSDGYESQWQINYLSPHIFTSTLMPLLLSTASASGTLDRVRVLNVCSDLAFWGPKEIDYQDVNLSESKGMMVNTVRYGHSKQASIRDAKEINDRYSSKGVTAYSFHPGVTSTGLQGGDPSIMGRITKFSVKISRTTVLDASLNSLYCATSPEAPKHASGKYLAPVAKINNKADPWLDDTAGNAKLWRWSEDVLAALQ